MMLDIEPIEERWSGGLGVLWPVALLNAEQDIRALLAEVKRLRSDVDFFAAAAE